MNGDQKSTSDYEKVLKLDAYGLWKYQTIKLKIVRTCDSDSCNYSII